MGDFTQVLDSVPECGQDLRKQEVFVDSKGIAVTALTSADGETSYIGTIQLNTQQGPVNLGFKILEAVSPLDAASKWRAAAQAAIKEAGQQLKENQRRIVLPSHTPSERPPFQHKPN